MYCSIYLYREILQYVGFSCYGAGGIGIVYNIVYVARKVCLCGGSSFYGGSVSFS